MSVPISAGMSTIHHPKRKDENGNVWVETPTGKHIQGENEPLQAFYVGYSSNDGVRVNVNGYGNYTPSGYNYGNVSRSATTAYKANAAGTANKIAQGGMTKDDILKYNIKHPNEIAGDNPANNTALNTNTALRR